MELLDYHQEQCGKVLIESFEYQRMTLAFPDRHNCLLLHMAFRKSKVRIKSSSHHAKVIIEDGLMLLGCGTMEETRNQSDRDCMEPLSANKMVCSIAAGRSVSTITLHHQCLLLFPCPAFSTPFATLLVPSSKPVAAPASPSPTAFPALPVVAVIVSPMPRPAAPATPPVRNQNQRLLSVKPNSTNHELIFQRFLWCLWSVYSPTVRASPPVTFPSVLVTNLTPPETPESLFLSILASMILG